MHELVASANIATEEYSFNCSHAAYLVITYAKGNLRHSACRQCLPVLFCNYSMLSRLILMLPWLHLVNPAFLVYEWTRVTPLVFQLFHQDRLPTSVVYVATVWSQRSNPSGGVFDRERNNTQIIINCIARHCYLSNCSEKRERWIWIRFLSCTVNAQMQCTLFYKVIYIFLLNPVLMLLKDESTLA